MMSTHSTEAAEEYHTEKQQQVGRHAAVPVLAYRPWIYEQSITHCQHTVEPYQWLFGKVSA